MNPDFRWIFQFSFGIETSIYYIKFRVYKIEICAFNRSIDAFKAHNNGISNQNLSETAQTPAKFVEITTLVHLVKAVPGYTRKKWT